MERENTCKENMWNIVWKEKTCARKYKTANILLVKIANI